MWKVRQAAFIGIKEGGLKFRTYRSFKSPTVFMQVDPNYMDGAFKQLGLGKHEGTETGIVKNFIEQPVSDRPLSAEAYRAVLSRLA